MGRLRRLDMADGWSDNLARFVPIEHSQVIYGAFKNVLAGSGSLTSLSLRKMTLDLDFFHTVHALHHLHTLDLDMSYLSSDVIANLVSESITPVQTSVYNLRLKFMDDDSLWYALLLCPQLRTLSIYAPVGELPSPPRGVWGERCSFFSTLERLSLWGLGLSGTFETIGWLFTSPRKERLTHVKIHSYPGMSDPLTLNMLLAFRGAPLQVLVLEGLAEAELLLFNEISHRFPGILGLTVVRRASPRQIENKKVIWPHASWEYAQQMSAFPQLRHFGWNIDKGYISPTTSILLRFDDGFCDPEKDIITWMEAQDNDNFDDDHWTPKLFALRCPKLQTYTSEPIYIEWRISRPRDGPVLVHKVDFDPGYPTPTNRGWDTDRSENWPAILPATADRIQYLSG